MFPQEISWNAKSGAVGRILETWNIGADSVIFVDDSPMELAEVASAHPGIQCLPFPVAGGGDAYEFLRLLRNLCGKPRVSAEDAIRLESIRQSAALREAGQEGGAAAEEFLQQADAVLTFDFEGGGADPRALELVNKTNQFNLNGLRVTSGEWQARLSRPGAFAATVSYRDRYGPLGKIAVFEGRHEGDSVLLSTWVMSCRAFSRRIEHQCLQVLFERFGVSRIQLAYTPTSKNGPLQDFLTGMVTDLPPETITRELFDEKRPPLYHQVTVSQLVP
jgi:FkbH-like protein